MSYWCCEHCFVLGCDQEDAHPEPCKWCFPTERGKQQTSTRDKAYGVDA